MCARCRGEIIVDPESGERVCTKCGFVAGYSDVDNGFQESPSDDTEEL